MIKTKPTPTWQVVLRSGSTLVVTAASAMAAACSTGDLSLVEVVKPVR